MPQSDTKALNKAAVAEEIWDMIDAASEGKMNKRHFKEALKKLPTTTLQTLTHGHKFRVAWVNRIFNAIDTDDSDTVEKAEFVTYMTNHMSEQQWDERSHLVT